jgi:CRISPR-associated protein Cmr2
MTHLLRIHIGPVQEMIAAARRSRDLWYGSWLLSELSKAAAQAIVKAEAAGVGALIFPAPMDAAELRPDESDLSVANEIVAVIEGHPAVVAQAARDAVAARRDELVQNALGSLRDRLDKGDTWVVAEAQLKDFIEFYWVAVPYETGHYRAARELADRLLAARKNTRTFDPVGWGRNRPKSSLDGARESVIPGGDSGNDETMYKHYKARGGEHLSGVDLLKRLGNAGAASRFPSTSHMAAMPLKAQLAGSDTAAAAWRDYIAPLPDRVREFEHSYHDLRLPVLGDLDGSMLFASRLLDHLQGAALKSAEAKLRAFFKATDIPEPIPYYALLVGDGDRMGQAIRSLVTPEDNQAFSRALAGFAAAARQIVRDHDGAAIYAGGDDVLALLPLHTAVSCAAALAAAFATQLAAYPTDEGPPTFSAGIAIVHHLEPLEDALNLGRDAEKAAKAISGKNALAVILDKRSGVPRAVAGKWGALDRRLLNLADLHAKEVIPDRLAYQLLDTYHLLGGESAFAAGGPLRDVLSKEAERIIDRKRVAGGQSLVDDAHKAYVRRPFTAADTSITAVADELVIAALLAKAIKLAGAPSAFEPEEMTNA